MNQRGFIQLPLMAWGAIGAGAIILVLGVSLKIQSARLESCKAEYAAFVATTEALGKAAEKAAKDKEAKDKLAKETADAENARTTASLKSAIAKLRNERSRGRFLPPAATAAASPDRAAFDREELERAIRTLDSEVQGLVDEGSKAVTDLNSAKTWAQQRGQ